MKVLSISACPLLVLLLVYSSRAIAAETPPKANEDSAFTKADVNNDGRLGPEEVKNDTAVSTNGCKLQWICLPQRGTVVYTKAERAS